jgi:hypothetical protein
MNWEALAAISEAAGAVAILVSLIYVGIQIRQNTQQFARSVKANELAAFERNVESANRVRELLVLHPELSDLLLKGFKGHNNLHSLDKFRFGMLLRNILSTMQGAYFRHLVVDHDPQEFEGGRRLLDDLLMNSGVRDWLESNEPDWRPEFRSFVDSRLKFIKKRIADAAPDVSAGEQ